MFQVLIISSNFYILIRDLNYDFLASHIATSSTHPSCRCYSLCPVILPPFQTISHSNIHGESFQLAAYITFVFLLVDPVHPSRSTSMVLSCFRVLSFF
jgi:hypothetical protein